MEEEQKHECVGGDRSRATEYGHKAVVAATLTLLRSAESKNILPSELK